MDKTFLSDPVTLRNPRAFWKFSVIETCPYYCFVHALEMGRGGDCFATNAKVMLFLKRSVDKSQRGM